MFERRNHSITSGSVNDGAVLTLASGTVDLRGYGDPAGLVLKNSASEAIALTDGNIKLPTGYAFYPQDVSTPAESLASSAAYTVGACTHRNNAYGFCEVCQVSITGASISVGTDLTIIITRRCMMPPW